MRIGAHVSAAGGVDRTIDRAVEIGAEAVQLFASPPQGWAFKPIAEEAAAAFRAKAAEHGVGPNVFHAIYLVSLGSADTDLVRKGVQSLVSYMNAAHDLGIMGVIFHLGSHRGRGFEAVFRQVCESLTRVLDNSPDDTLLIIENSAGMGDHLGSTFAEIGAIRAELANPRVKVCLDTQHCFAAGYDLTTKAGVAKVMREFDRDIGTEHLAAVHCNDSKAPLGGALDRHENIGEGHMGLAAFDAIMGHTAFRHVPFYLEVPGYEGKGPDQRSVDTLKSIRRNLAVPV